MHIDMDSNDCDWPYTIKSSYYASLWSAMLGEASRELNYEAGIAGISAGLKVGTKIQFEHWSYNDKVEPYLKELFNFIQNFETDEAFFNNKVDRYKRSLKNSLQAEPY